MKKSLNFLLCIITSLLFVNWTKQTSNAKICSGTVTFLNNQKNESNLTVDELVDIKIGTSPEFCENKDIVVYRKPKDTKINPKEHIEYMFDLEKVSEIETDSKDPIYKFDDHEFVNLNIKFINKTFENFLIPKTKKIVGKLKKNGIIAAYPFDSINKLLIHKCIEKEEK